MEEDVFAVFSRDEAEAFVFVEILYSAFHLRTIYLSECFLSLYLSRLQFICLQHKDTTSIQKFIE